MNFSIIVPSYNGAKKLPNLLSALEKQADVKFEVIIVIDGSTDNTIQVINNQKWHLDLTILEQQNKGRAATRNKGVAVAKNEMLLFFDDDIIPLPDCIRKHRSHHELHPGTLLTGGTNEETTKNSSEILKYKSFLSTKWLKDLKNAGTKPLPQEQIFATAANCSISKTLFDKIGGFDERLTDAEDYDFGLRANKLKIPIYYKYDVFGWHDDPITVCGYIKRQRQYTIGQLKLIKVHPEYVTNGFIKLPYKPQGFKGLAFKLFCHKFWIHAFENNLFAKLPISIKYRLYDYILTANGVLFPEIVLLN